jgi:hypothetical protein
MRRTGRAVKAAKRMAERFSATLPAQMQTWKETMALYRLLNEKDVIFEALMQPHWHQTRNGSLLNRCGSGPFGYGKSRRLPEKSPWNGFW